MVAILGNMQPACNSIVSRTFQSHASDLRCTLGSFSYFCLPASLWCFVCLTHRLQVDWKNRFRVHWVTGTSDTSLRWTWLKGAADWQVLLKLLHCLLSWADSSMVTCQQGDQQQLQKMVNMWSWLPCTARGKQTFSQCYLLFEWLLGKLSYLMKATPESTSF